VYYDDNDNRPKWDRPEIEDWDDDGDSSREYNSDIIGCMPSSTPCWPRQCWPRPCFPRQCWPRQCWPRKQCWPRQNCWPRPCSPNQCWPRRY